MTVFWLIRGSASPPLFYCRWPCSDWSVSWSRLHSSNVDDRVLIDAWDGLASIVQLSMTVFWLVLGRSRLRCSIVLDRVLIGPWVGLASIVILSMTVFWLVRRSVSHSLFYCRWPRSDWSVARSRLHCSIVVDRVLIDPWVGLASIVLLSMTVFWFVRRSVSHPLFYCAWPCSDRSVGRSLIHCSIVDDRFLIDPYVGLASIVHLSMTVFWLVYRSVSPPLFYWAWPCSDWSWGFFLVSIVLLSMSVF